MQRRTTTLQIQKAIKSNCLHLIKAEIYNKNTRKTDAILNDKFLDDFEYFCESGIFIDAIGWKFERNYKTGRYEAEAGRMNPDSDIIVTVYLRRNNNTTDEEITKLLLFKESEE